LKIYKIVIDTNVFISSLLSKKGASYKILSNIDSDKFIINISVPLIIEYKSVAKRKSLKISKISIDDILDFICANSIERKIHYLWRPFLKDPKDDMILELAVESESDFIITYNTKDFKGTEQFGIIILKPNEFLNKIGLTL
jgi:putative PIN family toxin of toxin-antitoxin system